MLLRININNGIKEPTHCNTSQIHMFCGYVKVRESFYTQLISCVNTVPNHSDTKLILPRYECSCMMYRPEWY